MQSCIKTSGPLQPSQQSSWNRRFEHKDLLDTLQSSLTASPPPFIGVTAPSCSGKTTFAHELLLNNLNSTAKSGRCLYLHLDFTPIPTKTELLDHFWHHFQKSLPTDADTLDLVDHNKISDILDDSPPPSLVDGFDRILSSGAFQTRNVILLIDSTDHIDRNASIELQAHLRELFEARKSYKKNSIPRIGLVFIAETLEPRCVQNSHRLPSPLKNILESIYPLTEPNREQFQHFVTGLLSDNFIQITEIGIEKLHYYSQGHLLITQTICQQLLKYATSNTTICTPKLIIQAARSAMLSQSSINICLKSATTSFDPSASRKLTSLLQHKKVIFNEMVDGIPELVDSGIITRNHSGFAQLSSPYIRFFFCLTNDMSQSYLNTPAHEHLVAIPEVIDAIANNKMHNSLLAYLQKKPNWDSMSAPSLAKYIQPEIAQTLPNYLDPYSVYIQSNLLGASYTNEQACLDAVSSFLSPWYASQLSPS